MSVTHVTTEETAPAPRGGGVMEWLTTTDHKKIGIMYLVNSFVFFLIGGSLALLMRTQLARPDNHVLSAHLYNEVFTIHGTIMIFLVIFPFLAGFGNYIVPLQIGASDMAFARMNNFSFWLLPVAGALLSGSFLVPGGATAAGWTLYAVVYFLFGHVSKPWHAWALFAVYGLYFGLTEGVQNAFVADLVPASRGGAAFGWYNLAIGIGALPASLIFGLIWDRVNPHAAFTFGGSLALAAAVAIAFVLPRQQQRAPGRS